MLSIIGISINLIMASLALVAAIYFFRQQRENSPFIRNVLVISICAQIILLIFEFLSHNDFIASSSMEHFLDIKSEFTPGPLFAASQLFFIGITGIILGVRSNTFKPATRTTWILLGGIFLFLSLDEFYGFHEVISGWRIIYGALAIGIAAMLITLRWRWIHGKDQLFLLIFCGGILMGLGGLTLEPFMFKADESYDFDLIFQLQGIEETLETAGSLAILLGFLLFAQHYLDQKRWQWFKWMSLRIILLFAVSGIGYIWVLPSVESIAATPVNTVYDDGSLRLDSYRLAEKAFHPGDTVDITIYWESRQELRKDYSLSVQLLAHPDVESIAGVEEVNIGQVRNIGWFPNIIMRKSFRLTIPDDVETSRSYWLALRVWSGNYVDGWQNTTGLTISSDDAQLVNDDLLVLDSIAVIADTEPIDLPNSVEYNFDHGFVLRGISDIPSSIEVGESLELNFQWQTKQAVSNQLIQFVHLIAQDTDDVFIHDSQPFENRFPTQDWQADIKIVDQVTFTLPDTLGAGTYDLYTGFYDVATNIRTNISDADNNSLTDSIIPLGVIEIVADN